MKTYTGFNSGTAEKLLLDAGAFFKNFTVGADTYETAKAAGKLIGATSGGGEFSAIPEVRQVEVDGVRGRAKGLTILDSWSVNMKANVIECSEESIKMSLIASTTTTEGDYDKITGNKNIELSDYIDNITWVGTLSGSDKPVIIQVYNALSIDGLTITPQDKNQGVIALNFYGHYDVDEEGTEEVPFAIFYPKAS